MMSMVEKFFTVTSMAISTFKNQYSFLKWGAMGSKGEHSGRGGERGGSFGGKREPREAGGAIGGDSIDV